MRVQRGHRLILTGIKKNDLASGEKDETLRYRIKVYRLRKVLLGCIQLERRDKIESVRCVSKLKKKVTSSLEFVKGREFEVKSAWE